MSLKNWECFHIECLLFSHANHKHSYMTIDFITAYIHCTCTATGINLSVPKSAGNGDCTHEDLSVPIVPLVTVSITASIAVCIIGCLIGAVLHRTLSTRSCCSKKHGERSLPRHHYDDVVTLEESAPNQIGHNSTSHSQIATTLNEAYMLVNCSGT